MPAPDASRIGAIVDGVARIVSNAIDGHIYAAGVTAEVTAAAPRVVPFSDDFGEAGWPAVTIAAATWKPIWQPGNERLHVDLFGAVWRPSADLDVAIPALYLDLARILDAWPEHMKAYLTEATLQSALLTGGPGLVPAVLPGQEAGPKLLTLPFTVEVVCNLAIVAKPA